MTALHALVGLGGYGVLALVTLGYLARHKVSHRKAFTMATIWPAYWLTMVGPVATFQVVTVALTDMALAILRSFHRLYSEQEEAFLLVWLVPAVPFFFYQWGVRIDACDGVVMCVLAPFVALIKALGWPVLLLTARM